MGLMGLAWLLLNPNGSLIHVDTNLYSLLYLDWVWLVLNWVKRRSSDFFVNPYWYQLEGHIHTLRQPLSNTNV